jgi:two-component system cell cycle response regulator CtrA
VDVDARLEALQSEVGRLRERIAVLEGALGFDSPAPVELRLTPHEALLFNVLTKREMVTKSTALSALYSDFGKDEAEPKIVDVFICKLRKKVRPFGIEVETVWGQGYRMSAESKAIVQQMRAAA